MIEPDWIKCMEIADRVSTAIHHKNRDIWRIAPDSTVYAAIQLMAEKNVGALLVMEGDALLGLVSERDYTRNVILRGKSSKGTPVREVMTTGVACVTPEHSVEECLQIMTEKRVRHLPVLENGAVIGIVSIGDLVKWIISAQNALIEQLDHYITGAYPA
jgi:CBS domain-containing protein